MLVGEWSDADGLQAAGVRIRHLDRGNRDLHDPLAQALGQRRHGRRLSFVGPLLCESPNVWDSSVALFGVVSNPARGLRRTSDLHVCAPRLQEKAAQDTPQ